MNSRDAAYDEEKYHALIDPLRDFELPPRTPISAVSASGGLNGHAEVENDVEPPIPKKKRKRKKKKKHAMTEATAHMEVIDVDADEGEGDD